MPPETRKRKLSKKTSRNTTTHTKAMQVLCLRRKPVGCAVVCNGTTSCRCASLAAVDAFSATCSSIGNGNGSAAWSINIDDSRDRVETYQCRRASTLADTTRPASPTDASYRRNETTYIYIYIYNKKKSAINLRNPTTTTSQANRRHKRRTEVRRIG
jgi:hypothetical protein